MEQKLKKYLQNDDFYLKNDDFGIHVNDFYKKNVI